MCKEADLSWSYLFVNRFKLGEIRAKLGEKYNTFIHQDITYKVVNKRPKEITRYTIPGLLFVQGEQTGLQRSLAETFSGVYLARDCATGKVATISDRVMQAFMKVAQVDPTRIRFLPHAFDYYAAGNTLVKITSGLLSGVEGYRLRIARNRCIVTSIGGMTISISGIHNDSFENVEEYTARRKQAMARDSQTVAATRQLTTVQREIDSFFFQPQNELDALVMINKCSKYAIKVRAYAASGAYHDMAETALFLLEEIGLNFSDYDFSGNAQKSVHKELLGVVGNVNKVLTGLLLAHDSDVPAEMRTAIAETLASLKERFPFMEIKDC